jgi:arylsulfatase A-like enzyme
MGGRKSRECGLPGKPASGVWKGMPRFSVFFAVLLLWQSAMATPPNVVFILADDLGWTDLGCQGSRFYETPHLDRLASDGLRLTQFHACQNCQPTRAALLSGQYSPRTGVYTVGSIDRFPWWRRSLRPVDNVTELPLDRTTVAQALQKSGYATGMFGKWHLGESGGHHPAKRGFDEALVTMGRHFGFRTNPPSQVPEGQYLADFLTDKAVDFIHRHREKPFFLYLPHFGVHSPHEAKPELIKRFRRKAAAGGHHDPVYAAMIASIDESVGRVVQTLADLQLTERTVVIFSSDNGGVGGYRREGLRKAGDITDNAPLRSGKGSLYEGGTRVPFIVRWPGTIPAGTTSDAPGIHVDLFPTLLEIASAQPPGQTLDGTSLVPVFRKPATTDRPPIFQHFPGYLGAGENSWRTTPVSTVQQGPWKLLEFLEDQRTELYHLAKDPGETRNLAADEPSRTTELRTALHAWRQRTGARMPTAHEAGSRPPGFRRAAGE